jgi:hypothetical protein
VAFAEIGVPPSSPDLQIPILNICAMHLYYSPHETVSLPLSALLLFSLAPFLSLHPPHPSVPPPPHFATVCILVHRTRHFKKK